MADSFDITLDSLGRTYAIPTGGATDWRNGVSRYLRDSATVINSFSGGGTITTPVVNVRNYGATGNGTTDDTVAIQAAMTFLATSGTTGGTLYFPSGTYKYTSRLQFGVAASQRNVRITGDGVSSVLKPTGAFSTNPTVEFRNCDYWSVQDLKLDASARTGSGDGILVDGSSYGLCTNVTLVGSSRYGINISQVAGSGLPAYNTVTGNVYATNSTANVHVQPGTFGNITNERQAIFPGPYSVDVKTQFGVAADGATDDTVAVQAALDFGYAEIVANRPCELVFPPGDIKISTTLLWRGNASSAPALRGAVPTGVSFNGCNTRFLWYGSANGVMFFAQQANRGVLQDLCFDGRSIAGIIAHLSASTYADPAILAATSGIRVLRCAFKHAKIATVGNGCVALGTDPALTGGDEFQQSEVVFRDCAFVGEDNGAGGFTYAGMKAYGVKTLSSGNCKNFAIYDSSFTTCNVALDWTNASGSFVVTNFNAGNVRTALASGGGQLSVIGGDIECADVDDFMLLFGTGGAIVGVSALIEGLQAVGYMAGALGTFVSWGGQLELKYNFFSNNNYSVSGNPDIVNPYKLICGSTAASRLSVLSEGNWYQGCGLSVAFAPFFDGSGNALAPVRGVYGGENALKVASRGDLGGSAVSPVVLGEFNSDNITLFAPTLNGPLALRYGAATTDITAGNSTFLGVNATTGNRIITLPSAAATPGRFYVVTKTDVTANTVTCNGKVLANQYESVLQVSTGSAWLNLLFV